MPNDTEIECRSNTTAHRAHLAEPGEFANGVDAESIVMMPNNWSYIRRLTCSMAFLVMASATQSFPACPEMPIGMQLEAESKVGRPISEIVEALLHDAEKVYAVASRLVVRTPRTSAESSAIPERTFLIEECHSRRYFLGVKIQS